VVTTFWWHLYAIARHPDVQHKLYTEIDDLCQGGTFTSRHISHAPYLKHVFKESIRRFPTAPFVAHELPEDISVGGYNIPAGVRNFCFHFHIHIL